MQSCSFCIKRSEKLQQINVIEVTIGRNVIKIKNLLHVFQNDLVKFLLDDKDALICHDCLQQLRSCYDFAQIMKESGKKCSREKKLKPEHNDTEAVTNVDRNETVKSNITVNSFNTKACSSINIFDANLKPILPRPASSEKFKKTSGSLDHKARLYKCLLCAESFKSYKHLSEHEKDLCKNNVVKYVRVCKFCHKCYSTEDFLNDHVSLKHAQGEFLCCLCQDKVFTAKGYLSRHIQKVHKHVSLQYFCGECGDICLPSQEEVREHFLNAHPSESHKSLEYDMSSSLNDEDMDLEMHEEFLDEFLLAHTNDNSFQFSECWDALDLHLPDMLHASASNLSSLQEFAKAYACPKCYEQFKSPQPLLKHLADIHGLPVLVCRICRKCFTSFKDFKRHKMQICFKSSKPQFMSLSCPYCSKTFNDSIYLKQHIRIVHCQLKKHICQLCDKQFSTLDHLKKHVLSQHQNERKHVCTVCNKRFTQMGHLKQHLAIHTTGKTIQCSVCSVKFWRKIDLETHLQKNHFQK